MAPNHRLGVLQAPCSPFIRVVAQLVCGGGLLLCVKPPAGTVAPWDPQPLTMLFQRFKASVLGS